jgi:predicted glycosyltransferase
VTSRPIGYYVHHQGEGHRQRALAIADAAGGRVTLLGTGLAERNRGFPCVDLPDDRMWSGFDGDDHVSRPSSLHYAPIDHDGIRQRVARMTQWIATAKPGLLIVDVSVEVAMLARLASVPTVYVRLSGHRHDRPHLEAFEGAAMLLAPFHADLDDERTPAAIRQKTFYAPGIVDIHRPSVIEKDVILVVLGRGAPPSDGELWAEAASAVPAMTWRVIGPCRAPRKSPSNLELRGWVEEAGLMVASAAVVVGGAGDGLVASVIAHRRPFICIPEPRPFQEQISQAKRLSELGASITCMARPSPNHWPDLVRRALALKPDALARLDDWGGVHHVVSWLSMLAREPNAMRDRSR